VGTLTLKIEGRQALSWSADEGSIMKLRQEVEAAAARAGLAPDAFAAKVAVDLLGKPVGTGSSHRQSSLMTVAYFILSQNTGRADRPGKFRDYLAAWDLEFDLCRDGGGISIDVTGGRGSDFAGIPVLCGGPKKEPSCR
jgi:hypothetical protein